jgi:hypothetical protein
MKRDSHCLRRASSRSLPAQSVTRELHYMCKPAACTKVEGWRGLTRTLWGAYGVVGFSGVKDARKSVVSRRRPASARSPTHRQSCRVQTVCTHSANSVRVVGKRCADMVQTVERRERHAD